MPTNNTALAAAYGAFLRLKWTPEWAGERRLVGSLPKHWYGPGEMVVAEVDESGRPSLVSVTQNDVEVAPRRLQKRQGEFSGSLTATEAAGEAEQQQWQDAVANLRQKTEQQLQENAAEEAALDKVMVHGKSGYAVTFAITGICILVFILMAVTGVGFFSPDTDGLIKWGANASYYTLGGEGWRLLTAVFVHIGIVHLIFNMYALFNIGAYLEPMLGRVRYAALYIATGVIASLVSLWWHDGFQVSAGASGAIFGLYGCFLALLTTDLIPKKTRAALLKSIGIFILFNLTYGLKAGVDNAAHVGGLCSGIVAGFILLPFLKEGRHSNPVPAVVLLVAAVAGSMIYLSKNRYDSAAFMHLEERTWSRESKVIDRLKKSDDVRYANTLEEVAIPEWKAALAEWNGAAGSWRLPAKLVERRALIRQYFGYRLRESELLLEGRRGGSDEGIEDVQAGMDSVGKKLPLTF